MYKMSPPVFAIRKNLEFLRVNTGSGKYQLWYFANSAYESRNFWMAPKFVICFKLNLVREKEKCSISIQFQCERMLTEKRACYLMNMDELA